MKRVIKILWVYLLFGIVMALYVSVSGSFTLLTSVGGLSVFQYILFFGILLGLCWLPYSIAIIFSSYSDYFVFSDTPIILILYIMVFIFLDLCIIFRKPKDIS